jgi:rsbT antagonist protein RsbS
VELGLTLPGLRTALNTEAAMDLLARTGPGFGDGPFAAGHP